jgi:hypothetical protein
MVLKHPGGTPFAENGLASAEPVLVLPCGLCGRGVVDDGVSGVLFLTDCTCSWEVRDVVQFTVLDLSVWAGAMLADLERLSSTVVGICFSVIFMLFGVVAPMVTGPLLSLSVFLTD